MTIGNGDHRNRNVYCNNAEILPEILVCQTEFQPVSLISLSCEVYILDVERLLQVNLTCSSTLVIGVVYLNVHALLA